MARQYRIYVIRLSEPARPRIAPPGRDPRLPCVYVGYTSKTPEERFAQHKAGGRLSASIVERFGEALLSELYEGLAPMEDEGEALRMEAAQAEELRALGYAVYGSHGEPLALARAGKGRARPRSRTGSARQRA